MSCLTIRFWYSSHSSFPLKHQSLVCSSRQSNLLVLDVFKCRLPWFAQGPPVLDFLWSPAPNLAGLFKSSVLLITPNLTVQVLLPPWEAYNLSPFSFICFVFLLRWWLLRFLFGLLLLTIPPLKGMELVVLFRGLISFFHNEWLLVIDFVFSLARIFFCPLFKYSN